MSNAVGLIVCMTLNVVDVIDARVEERISDLATNLDTRFANLANELRPHFNSVLDLVANCSLSAPPPVPDQRPV